MAIVGAVADMVEVVLGVGFHHGSMKIIYKILTV